jgi:hypothetical protein
VPEEKTKFWEDRWQSFIDASPLSKRRNRRRRPHQALE